MDENVSQNMRKSETSIVGIVCKDGIVLGADRRSSAGGRLVVDKNSKKIKQINDSIAISCTGGVADILLSEKLLAAELRLKELKTKEKPSVAEAANLIGMLTYRNIRTPSMVPFIVGLLVAGVNEDGTTELYTIEPAGAVNKVRDYDANFSSGMPYILGYLERQYKKDLSVKEGVELAKESIKAAIERDTGSGNGIDVFTVTKEGIKQVVSQEIVPQYK